MSNSIKQTEQKQITEVGDTAMMTFVVAPASDHASGLNLGGLVDYINKNSDYKINLILCKDNE